MKSKKLYIYHTFLSRRNDLGHFHSINELTNQLDYIQEMGFTAVLTNPIFESADDSHGYHCVNFYEVDHRLGTMEDFDNLLRELEKRNMSYIMDITLNHCSDQSFYFQDFKAGKNDFFVAKNFPYNDRATNIRNSIYEYREDLGGKWLIAPFCGAIPAFNISSNNLRNEVEKILKFWLNKSPNNMHIRWDAAYHCKWSTDDYNGESYAKFIREVVDSINPKIQIISEAWWDEDLKGACIQYNNLVRNNFDFYNVFSVVNQIRSGKHYNDIHIDYCYQNPTTFFTSNHDISRLASMLDNDREKVKLFLKVMIEKTRNEDNVVIYYGTENDMEGLLWSCSDSVVRQNYPIEDMATVIKNKDSLFYYIKELIEKDKEKRGSK